MMKIVLLHGQNHKGSSYHIGRMLVDKLGEGHEIAEFFLPRDLQHFCVGCYQCIDDDTKCPFYTEKMTIMEQIERADLVVFTTPTYCMRASAGMKSFIEMTFTYWMPHRPKKCMFHKKAVIISTAAGAGTKTAIKDIKDTMLYWGISYVKTYGVSVQAMGWDKVIDKKKAQIDKDMTKLAREITDQKAKVSFKTKGLFMIMRMMQKSGMGSGPVEKQYWEENGWLGKQRPWKSV
jgi:multimeric flavodoxin WrbA